ncbi:MAG: geranylgeranylglyceryl/heptaprenylglyceryl phosphate synthase [Paludibacteraceae bacterium]|nr:geranylgeranylglyceryl/heptaprenylglyceryl phosphate synthase [Paludibacteraceae bacterium]
MIYAQISKNREQGQKMLAVLVDPDKCNTRFLTDFTAWVRASSPDFIFVGGSLVTESIDSVVHCLKTETDVPVVLFPGNATQLSPDADALLFLSLISGRNPEYLIGQQVVAAPQVRRSGIEVIPVGYMLIDGGTTTSVEYMSNTSPIPHGKNDIAVATAMAGEMLGLKMLYLEGGSGAAQPVSESMIAAVRQNISLPLIVGGGVRDAQTARKIYGAGADLLVVGNVLEKDLSQMKAIASVRNEF